MKSRRRAFAPALDGRLEDRLVMSAAGVGTVAQVAAAESEGAVLSTRTYNNILGNIHDATVRFSQIGGNQEAREGVESLIARQVDRLPFANRQGLTAEIVDSIQYYRPNQFRQLYSDIRATIAAYLDEQVAEGNVAVIRPPGGQLFSDSDILAPGAYLSPTPPDGESPLVEAVYLSTQTYNDVLVNVHKFTTQFGRSAGTPANYDRLAAAVGHQLNRLPFAYTRGLTAAVTDAILAEPPIYAPGDSQQLYQDVRATAADFLRDLDATGQIEIYQTLGLHLFSDSDILPARGPRPA